MFNISTLLMNLQPTVTICNKIFCKLEQKFVLSIKKPKYFAYQYKKFATL